MFGFDSRMLETHRDDTGSRNITNQNITEELCSSVVLVDEMNAFYTQAHINEKEILRFEGYTLESERLPIYYEWKVTGIYIYEEETKTALPDVDIDPVQLYEMLNEIELVLYEKYGKPQYYRQNRAKIVRADYNEELKQHQFIETYHEITNEKSFLASVSIEAEEIVMSQIPMALLLAEETKKQETLALEAKQKEQRLLGF